MTKVDEKAPAQGPGGRKTADQIRIADEVMQAQGGVPMFARVPKRA